MSFKFKRTPLEDLVYLETNLIQDSRGSFSELYKESYFYKAGIKQKLVQVNRSDTLKKDTIRGLHYQLNPYGQGKLVSVFSGKIFDVAVDIRKGSPTYGKFFEIELSAQKQNSLYVPVGFAHGFCTLENNTQVLYLCTESEFSDYNSKGILWNDPDIGIFWPTDKPILSEKDKNNPLLKDAENNYVYLKT